MENKAGWVVELEKGVWLISPAGYWGLDVTQCILNAKRYKTEASAKSALSRARKSFWFKDAKIYRAEE